MAENIKIELLGCSHAPRSIPYVCFTARKLSELLDRIKELDNKNFQNVYEFANNMDLPKDFLEELKSEYQNRNRK